MSSARRSVERGAEDEPVAAGEPSVGHGDAGRLGLQRYRPSTRSGATATTTRPGASANRATWSRSASGAATRRPPRRPSRPRRRPARPQPTSCTPATSAVGHQRPHQTGHAARPRRGRTGGRAPPRAAAGEGPTRAGQVGGGRAGAQHEHGGAGRPAPIPAGAGRARSTTPSNADDRRRDRCRRPRSRCRGSRCRRRPGRRGPGTPRPCRRWPRTAATSPRGARGCRS